MLSSQASINLSEGVPVQVAVASNPAPSAPVNAQPSASVQANMTANVTMATVQIPQMRVLQAIASRPSQGTEYHPTVQGLQQPQQQQIQILKTIPSSRGAEILIPTTLSTFAGVKTSFASPGKGAIVTIPNAKMVAHASIPTKLKVGDTIVIPTKTLNTFNSGGMAGQPVVIKHEQAAQAPGQLLFSTPTKLVVPSSAKSPIIGSPVTPQQSNQPRHGTPQQPNTPVSSTLASPMRLTTISPSSWTPSPLRYKRAGDYADQDGFPESIKKTRRTPSGHEKGSKGLRHFAMLVCEKVKQKITTTYNEVADELVAEYSSQQRHLNDQQYDQKNIRRRVYDALNVLMAMNIIYKDKKDIHWVGLPTNSVQELQALQSEKQKREQRIKQKTAQLHELILQQIAFKNLVQRNKRLQQTQGPPASNSAIQLPFIIVNTSKKTVIDCSISNDKYEYLFNFDNTFEIHDDIEVLKRMGMAYGLEKGSCSKEDLRTAQSLVPPVLRPYLEEMAGYKQSSNTGAAASTSSGHITDVSHMGQPGEGSAIGYESRILSTVKPDPEDQEVDMVVGQACTGDESQGSSSSFALTGPSSSSRSSSVDPLTAIRHGATPSPGLDLAYMQSQPSLSPADFDA